MAFGVLQSHRQTVRLKFNRSVGRFARSTDEFQKCRFLFVATVVDEIINQRESSLCINRRPDVALGRFNNDARARADAAVMSHVAAVRELDEAVAAAMECEHAVSALKKAVADAKGAHRTSAFASEAVTARGAAEELVAAARRVDAALTAAVVENLSAVRRGFGGSASRARPSPTSPSTVGRRRPSSAPRSPPDRFDVDENPARYALRRELAELDQRDTVARLTAVPVTTVRLRLTRFRPPATRTSPAVASRRVVPFRFARAASPPPGDPDGADALAALLPDMRAKLQLEHVAVVVLELLPVAQRRAERRAGRERGLLVAVAPLVLFDTAAGAGPAACGHGAAHRIQRHPRVSAPIAGRRERVAVGAGSGVRRRVRTRSTAGWRHRAGLEVLVAAFARLRRDRPRDEGGSCGTHTRRHTQQSAIHPSNPNL